MRALEVAGITPARYLLIAATRDEVLDYRSAVERYKGCRQIVIEGSDHALSDFDTHLPRLVQFLGL
jgi:hypothetical protein